MQTIIKHEYRDTRDKSSQFQTQIFLSTRKDDDTCCQTAKEVRRFVRINYR